MGARASGAEKATVPAGQAAVDRWLDRAIRVSFMLLLLAAGSLGLYWYSQRYVHATVSVLDRDSEIVESQIRNDPGDPGLRMAAASLYVEKGRYDDAIAQAEQVLQGNQDHMGALMVLGQSYARKGWLDHAATYFERAIEASRDDPMARSNLQLAQVHRSLGAIYLELGRTEEAAREFRESLLINRGDADAYHLLGQALVASGRTDEGIESYRKALRLVPNFPDVYVQLQRVYELSGDRNRADFARGMLLYGEGDYERAAETLRRAAEAVPDMAEVYLGLAMVYEKQKRLPEALESYRRAAAIDESSFAAKQGISRLERR